MNSSHILILILVISLFYLTSELKTLGNITFGHSDIISIDSTDSIFQISANFKKENYLYIYPTYIKKVINQCVFKFYFKEYSISDLSKVANYLKSDYSTIELNSELFINPKELNYTKASIFVITYGICSFRLNFDYSQSIKFPEYNEDNNFQLSQFTLKKNEDISIQYDYTNLYDDTIMILTKTSLRKIDVNLIYKNKDVTIENVAETYPNGYSMFINRQIFTENDIKIVITNKNDKNETIILGYNHYNKDQIFPFPIKNGFQLYLYGNSLDLYYLENSGEDNPYDQYFFYQASSKKIKLQFLHKDKSNNLAHIINEYSNMAHLKVDSKGFLSFDFTETPKRTGLYIQYIDYSKPEIAQNVLQPLVTGVPKSMLIPEGKSMFHYLPIQKESTTINYYLRFRNNQDMKVYFTTCTNYPENCPNLETQPQNYPIIENLGLWYSIPANNSELQLIYINCEKECSYDIIMTYNNDPLFLFPENNYTKFTSNKDGDIFILPVFEYFKESNVDFIYIDLNVISGRADLILKNRQTQAEITNYELKKIGNKKSYTIFKDEFLKADYFKNEIYVTVKPDQNYNNTMYNLMYGSAESNIKSLANNIINIELLKVDETKIFNFVNHKNKDLYISISTQICKMKITIDGKTETVYSYSNKLSEGNHKVEINLISDEGICNKGFEEEVMLFAYHDNTNILLGENTFIKSTFSTNTISFKHLFKFNNNDKSFNIEVEKLSGESLNFNYKLEKISFNSSQNNYFESAIQPIISKKVSFISTSQINSYCDNLNSNEICSLTITFTSEKKASLGLYLNKNSQNYARHLRNEALINSIIPDKIRFYYIDLNKNYDTEIIINSYGQDLEYSSSTITKQTDEEKILASLTSFSSGSNYHVITKKKDKDCDDTYCRLYIGVRVSAEQNLKSTPTTFSINYLFKDSGNLKSEIELPLNYFIQYKLDDLNEIKYSINIFKKTSVVLELYTINENEDDDSEITATFSLKGSEKEDLQPNEKIIKLLEEGCYEIIISNPSEDKKLLYKLRLSSIEKETKSLIIPILSSYSEKCTLDTENIACYYKLDIPIDSKDNKAQYIYFYIPEIEEVIISIKELDYTSDLSKPGTIEDYDKLSNTDIKRSNWYEYKIEDDTKTLLIKISLIKPTPMNLTLYSSFSIKPNVVTLNYGEKRIFTIDKLNTNEMNQMHFKINKNANKYRINLHAVRGNGIFTINKEKYPLGLDASYKENISIIIDSKDKTLDLFAINNNDDKQDQFAFTIDYSLITTEQLFFEIYQNKKNSFKFLKDSNLNKITFYMKANKTEKEYKKIEMNIKLYTNETKYDLKSYIVDKDLIDKIKKNDVKNIKLSSPVGTITKFIDGGSRKSGELSFLKLEIESNKFNNSRINEEELYIYLVFTQSNSNIKKVRIDLYPYEVPYSLPYNLPLMSNELFIEKIDNNSVYTLLFDKRDNYSEKSPKIKIDFVRPLLNDYEISFEHDLNDKKNPKIENETDIILVEEDSDDYRPYYYGKEQIFLDPKLKKLYILFNIKTRNKFDTYIFKYRYNKYDIVEKLDVNDYKFKVEGTTEDITYKVDVIDKISNYAQVVIILNAYKEEDIKKKIQKPELDYLSLNLLFNDFKPIDTTYGVYYKDKTKPINRQIRTAGIKESGMYYFTCIAIVIDNEREEYIGYKALNINVSYSSFFGALLNYMKNHVLSSIIIIIIFILVIGMIIVLYRHERRLEKQKAIEDTNKEVNEMKEGMVNLNPIE